MRFAVNVLVLWICLSMHSNVQSAEAKIIKVLPHLLDLEGRHTRYPSLFERDTYQAGLRKAPDRCSGLRFDIEWKARNQSANPLKLRIEAHGSHAAKIITLESAIPRNRWFGNWSSLTISGDDYKKFGSLISWRATIWDGETLLGEQKSFLW